MDIIGQVIQQIVFYVFAITAVICSLMVVFSKNPVRGALFLIGAFIASAVLWLLLQAEFLALILVLVYVGAVMTLFLFVVMMLNLDMEPLRKGFVRFLPVGILIAAIMMGLIIYIVNPAYFGAHIGMYAHPTNFSGSYSNVAALGEILYTKHVFPLELAAALLLVACVAAIALAKPRTDRRKGQNPAKQVLVKGKDRLKIVKMKSEKKG